MTKTDNTTYTITVISVAPTASDVSDAVDARIRIDVAASDYVAPNRIEGEVTLIRDGDGVKVWGDDPDLWASVGAQEGIEAAARAEQLTDEADAEDGHPDWTIEHLDGQAADAYYRDDVIYRVCVAVDAAAERNS